MAIEASRRLRRDFGSELILDEERALPHISLYHVAIAPERMEEFERELQRVMERAETGEMEITGLHCYREHGSLAIRCSKPRWLERLYLRIIRATDPLRDPDFDNYRAWNADRLSAGRRSYIERYGTPLVGRFFIPHITIGVVSDRRRLEEAARSIEVERRSFAVDEIAVCEQGEHHTCRRPLMRIGRKNS